MDSFVFFFGRNPVLSLAELETVRQTQLPATLLETPWKNAALVNGTLPNPTALQKQLGGTTKIGTVIFSLPKVTEKTLAEKLEQHFAVDLPLNKFQFALSCLGPVQEQEENAALSALKQWFKSQKLKALYKKSSSHKQQNQRVTNPQDIQSWGLLQSHTDFFLAKTKTETHFGVTLACSNPADWKFRDEKRPVKDNKEIVSIRLAKILINLAGLRENQTLLDPFCGYGTVLQEALLHGLHVIGLEKEHTKVQASQKNLAWIQKTFSTNKTFAVLQQDAAHANQALAGKTIEAVVTEPYLGPYLGKKPAPGKAQAILRELEPLYTQVFRVLAKILSPGKRVIIIFPVFEYSQNKSYRLPATVYSFAFRSCNPLATLGPVHEKAFPFYYQNPNNNIGREILVLQRQ